MPPDDVARVRLVLARELETINQYEELARTAEADGVRAFLRHLAGEEKEHVAEATALLRRLDPEQESRSASTELGPEHWEEGAGRTAGRAPAPPAAATLAGMQPHFTVGSLKGR